MEIIYPLFLFAVMNFYLRFRKKDVLSSVEKFMISLMSIGILFAIFFAIGNLTAPLFKKYESPILDILFMLAMTLLFPLIATEIVLFLYERFIVKKKK